MQNTKIEWCDATANFWWGCHKVSPGCANCYAETLSNRFQGDLWGPAASTIRQRKKGIWKDIPRWNRKAEKQGRRLKVFAMSMGDFFEDHPMVVNWRFDAMTMMEEATNIDWLVLTKRPENIGDMVWPDWLESWPKNVWLGTSVENQEEAMERIPELLKYPATVRFLSCEPLLGFLDLRQYLQTGLYHNGEFHINYNHGRKNRDFPIVMTDETGAFHTFEKIDWVIVGGESGHNARSMHPDWVRSIQNQCQEASVPFFFKQWGEWHPDCLCGKSEPCKTCDRPKPGKPGVMFRCGKKAGSELSGHKYQEFPDGKTSINTKAVGSTA